jgi:hypothetical protein
MTHKNFKTSDRELPRLRVFWGDGAVEHDDQPPPDPGHRFGWLRDRSERYWAGRNYASRRSARIAA